MKKHNLFLLLATLFLMIGIVGCTESETVEDENNDLNNEGTDNDPNSTNENVSESNEKVTESSDPWSYDGEPTTVKMLIAVNEEEFENRFKKQIEAEFPNIELELMHGYPNDHKELEELFAAQEIPDIIPTNPDHELAINLDAIEPIDDYIEKTGFDLSVFRENVIENLRVRDPRGENQLYGLPIESMLMAVYYNKDIFDRFGEPYPEDGMTWDEALSIARKLTVEHDGVQYKGLKLDRSNAIPYTQLSIPGTDPETGEILFTEHPDTKRFFDLLDDLRNIPGMMETEEDGFHTGAQNIAMWVQTAPWLPLLAPVGDEFNFDMVSTPTWSDHPNVAPTSLALSFNISKYSENKDAAWSVISYLASEEGQLVLSRAGSPPTIDSQEAYEEFGATAVEQYGKEYNTIAPFVDQIAEMPPYSRFDPEITFHGMDFISEKASDFLESDQDTVTFIREMGEEYVQTVEETKSSE